MVITDDFGQRIQMSLDQLADLVADVRRGVLDEVLAGNLRGFTDALAAEEKRRRLEAQTAEAAS